jgi:hypothetical protein
MLFQHLGYDHLSLTPFKHGHEPEPARKLLGDPDVNSRQLDHFSRLHPKCGVRSNRWRLALWRDHRRRWDHLRRLLDRA